MSNLEAMTSTLASRVWEIVQVYFPLAFVSFGGAAQVAVYHEIFVVKRKWLNDTIFAELFAISQAFPGPGNAMLVYSIAMTRAGLLPAIIGFLVWCLPGFIVLTTLGMVVGSTGDGLPSWLIYTENGIIAAALGLLALAAYRLSRTLITTSLARIIALVAFALGINISAPYVFPVIMVGGALVTVSAEYVKNWASGSNHLKEFRRQWKKEGKTEPLATTGHDVMSLQPAPNDRVITRRRSRVDYTGADSTSCLPDADEGNLSFNLSYGAELQIVPEIDTMDVDEEDVHLPQFESHAQPHQVAPDCERGSVLKEEQEGKRPPSRSRSQTARETENDQPTIPLTSRQGIALVIVWVLFFAASAAPATLRPASLPIPILLLFTFWFTGCVSFGGLAVVVPLLQNWLTSGDHALMKESDFIVGVAVTNAIPGPVYNFSGYFGAVAMKGAPSGAIAAILCWIGLFGPGLILITSVLPLWSRLRSHPLSRLIFSGFNSAAVGLLFSAFYGLWRKGVTPVGTSSCLSRSVGDYPVYVALSSAAFVGVGYLRISSPLVVLLGGVAGIIEYAVR